MTTSVKVSSSFERANCPQCGSSNHDVVIVGRDHLHNIGGAYYVVQCRRCGLWYQNPHPPVAEIERLYPAGYKPYTTSSSQSVPLSKATFRYLESHLGYVHLTTDTMTAQEGLLSNCLWWLNYNIAIKLIPSFVPGGRLLEIGCASGDRLCIYRELGWEKLYGVDINPRAVAIAQTKGFSVQCCSVEGVIDSYEDESFDVVVASMIVEHLLNPFETVEHVYKKLKPGGQFLFSTVQRDSLDFIIYHVYWYNLDLPRHMIFFRKKDIYAMLAKRFTLVELFHQIAPRDFVGSATFRLRDHQSVIDKAIIALGESRLRYLSLILALLGLTSRVSIRCRRK